ncbi:MAG: hypothetical protein OEV49_06800 [candidate division Zixibacteria bacterium]|nr:hypothetical protein [candidate division Zixibacteria bacterium]MDH3935743.1 hypothetical protein [candidate division Zixibacteria bacterium]MDH4033874.1 hypothetical protein [candidate division Zixibacteria bacterium]
MRFTKAILLTIVTIFALGSTIQAEAPKLLSYQGRLEDGAGASVADGTYEIAFEIYPIATGGAAVWSETQSSVYVADGFFNVLLGSVEPLVDSVFKGEERYLEITVGTQVLSPRTQLASVAYAHRISTVDGAKSGSLTGELTIYSDETIAFGPPSPAGPNATPNYIKLSFDDGASMAIYEPADSKNGDFTSTKKVEMRAGGVTLFGLNELDTTLQVLPNGDIVGVGQITMGENSSSGEETTVLGFENTADGDSSTIGGGSANVTTGTSSVIAGGYNNSVSGEGGTISGGSTNDVSGAYSVIPGGQFNEAAGDYSFAAGYRAKALHNGSFVWADWTEEDFFTTADDQFIIRAGGGVGIGTSSPLGLLEVAGATGDGSVNLPESSIASPEILDEPGLASSRYADEVVLAQYKANTDGIVTISISTPSSGYIIIRGGTTLKTSGTAGPNRAYLQISESPGGTLDLPYSALAGAGHYDGPNKVAYRSMTVERVFFKPAGTYDFELEGLAHPDNDLDAITSMANSYLTASYLPTSYGSVNAIVSNEDLNEFDMASPVQSEGSTAHYQVDLRELELRAAKARADAIEAERMLLEAQLKSSGGSTMAKGGE